MERSTSDLTDTFSAIKLDTETAKASRKRLSTASKFQEKRRSEALRRQQQARLDRTLKARQLACREEPDEAQAEEPVPDLRRGDQASAPFKEDTAFFAKQLMQPEWMTEVPAHLATDWFVMPRPEGARCLVIASRGSTVTRSRNGRVVHRFPSWLPGGSRSTLCGSDAYCILDCIFHEADCTFYVLDLMCWKGYALYDCNVDFRLFWRDTKFKEERDAVAGKGWSGECRYRFEPVPVYKCTAGGLKAAHSDKLPFQRDGCYFLHKEGHYDTDGPTPIALLWKDPECSPYFIDTDANGRVSARQQVILQCGEDRRVYTADDPPIALGVVPETLATARPGRLLKFTIHDGGIQFQEGEPVGADLRFEGLANQRRGRADSCSKIIFQHLARTSPIQLGHFTEALATEAESMQASSSPDGAESSSKVFGDGLTAFGSLEAHT